jgi:hypothetical protein
VETANSLCVISASPVTVTAKPALVPTRIAVRRASPRYSKRVNQPVPHHEPSAELVCLRMIKMSVNLAERIARLVKVKLCVWNASRGIFRMACALKTVVRECSATTTHVSATAR